jgi:YfiH family protein
MLPIARHAFTTRATRPGRGDGAQDYAALADQLGVELERVRDARQVHGSAVYLATRRPPEHTPEADVLIATDAAIAVVVRTADCAPILLADRRTGAVAAVHAGWRGTRAGAARAAVAALRSHAGSAAADLVAAVGPSIGPCCYQVGGEVREAFLSTAGQPDPADWFTPDDGRWRLDIWKANTAQLRAAGLPADAIHVAGHCTACRLDRYYSYRAEGPGTGRQFAGIRPAAT